MVLSLSGGLDTRIIAGILAKHEINMISVSCGSYLENLISRKVASTLGFEHWICPKKDKFRILTSKGIKYLLSGAFFDEVNGSWTGFKAKTYPDFAEAQIKGLKQRYTFVGNYYEKYNVPIYISPVLHGKVLIALESIPYQKRIGKKIQRYILEEKFPRLWNIPYYNSLLPNSCPFQFHRFSSFFHFHSNWLQLFKKIGKNEHVKKHVYIKILI